MNHTPASAILRSSTTKHARATALATIIPVRADLIPRADVRIPPWCHHPKRTAMLVTSRIGFRRHRRGERHRPLSSWSRTWRRSTLPMRERGRSSTAVMRLGTL